MIHQMFFQRLLEAQRGHRWMLALCTAHQGASFDRKLEAVGEGYPAGGQTLGAPTVEVEGRKLYLLWPTPTVFEGAVTVEASHCAIYDQATGAVAVSLEFGGVQASRNGPFIVTVPRDAFVVRV